MTGLLTSFADYIRSRIKAHQESKPMKKGSTFHKQLAAFRNADTMLPLLSEQEVIILLTVIIPHVQPDFFKQIIEELFPETGEFPALGGIKAPDHSMIFPTLETVQFILAGNDKTGQLQVEDNLSNARLLTDLDIVRPQVVKKGRSMTTKLAIAPEWLAHFVYGKNTSPFFGVKAAEQSLTTEKDWNDLRLQESTKKQVDEIHQWLEQQTNASASSKVKRMRKVGYKALFFGRAGTGKTLTAALLGKQFKKEVYQIDLSMIVSKYIGETEKNLERIFREAEREEAILLFDEADALFGKRTDNSTTHDKYANQETSYLLERMDKYPGLCILSGTMKQLLNEPFIHQLDNVVHFPLPGPDQRLFLWQKYLKANLPFATDFSLKDIAAKYELNEYAIWNAANVALLQAFSKNEKELTHDTLTSAIRSELETKRSSY